jgi:hypothetical protein
MCIYPLFNSFKQLVRYVLYTQEDMLRSIYNYQLYESQQILYELNFNKKCRTTHIYAL